MVKVADTVKQTEAQVLQAIKGGGMSANRYKSGYGSGIVGGLHVFHGGNSKGANTLAQGETLETIDRAAQKGARKSGAKGAAARRPY